MSEVPGPEVVDRLRAVNSRLRELLAASQAEVAAVRAAKDAELVALRLEKDAEIAELRAALQALALRVAELERQRDSGSDDSGTPSSKEPIAAKARRKAERKIRRDSRDSRDKGTGLSSRERSANRARGGQPGHPGHALVRDRDPSTVNRSIHPRCAGDAAPAWTVPGTRGRRGRNAGT